MRTELLRRFLTDRWSVVALAFLLAMLLSSLLNGSLTGFEATATSSDTLIGPSPVHWLGSDELGRDSASRLMFGARSSLLVAAGSALAAALVGVPLGVLAGYFGRAVDAIAMRIIDVILAVPTVLVALVFIAALGPSTTNMIIAIASASAPQFARLARAGTLEIRERDFVLAERAMGAGHLTIMVRVVLPNILAPLIVQFVVTAAGAIVVAAGLSFLGLGIPPPEPTWGGMLQQAKAYMYQSPWYGIFPGVVLTLTVIALDRIGASLRRAMGSTQDLGRASASAPGRGAT